MDKKTSYLEYRTGLIKGMPIALGYLPVSFTFGLIAVKGGLSPWFAIFISMTNLTSAGQFAGVNLIIAQASLLEITFTTFVINIRYMLMSLSLSQKLSKNIPISLRSIMAFGITDETFTFAAMEKGEVTFPFMMGLITGPYVGWALGTALGAFTSSYLPQSLQSSMGITLYAMFIAIVVPAAKASKAALLVVLTAIALSTLLNWVPSLSSISAGWRITVATIIAASIGALFFPKDSDEND